jgi:hypothetical protein
MNFADLSLGAGLLISEDFAAGAGVLGLAAGAPAGACGWRALCAAAAPIVRAVTAVVTMSAFNILSLL